MNTILTTPDVKLFVRAVREHLGDLTEEEREELVGGLEGDMSDLVAERGVDALPEPADYAEELRAAAGFGPERRAARTWLERTDHARAWVGHLLATRHGAAAWAFVGSVQPVWWVFRAWLAAQLIDVSYGADLPTPVPTLMGVWPGVAVTAAFVVVSVQVGRGRWWPGGARHRASRVVLLALNLFAVVLTPLVLGQFPGSGSFETAGQGAYEPPGPGLALHGTPVRNVYAYDAAGHPLTGIQLVDQDGHRLTVQPETYDDSAGTNVRMGPWSNGRTALFNVFPLTQQPLDLETGKPSGAAVVETPPYASLPPVTLVGVRPSTLLSPAQLQSLREAAVAKRRDSGKQTQR